MVTRRLLGALLGALALGVAWIAVGLPGSEPRTVDVPGHTLRSEGDPAGARSELVEADGRSRVVTVPGVEATGVTVRVIDETESGVPGAVVRLLIHGQEHAHGEVDEHGARFFEAPAGAGYRAELVTERLPQGWFGPLNQARPRAQPTPGSFGHAIELAPGSVATITLAVERAARVFGVAREADGTPFPNAEVTANPFQHQLETRTIASGADGAFDFPGLRPGHWSVTMKTGEAAGSELPVVPGRTAVRALLTLAPGQERELNLQHHVEAGHVTGQVFSQAGHALVGHHLWAELNPESSTDSSGRAAGKTGVGGEFLLEGLPAGEVKLWVVSVSETRPAFVTRRRPAGEFRKAELQRGVLLATFTLKASTDHDLGRLVLSEPVPYDLRGEIELPVDPTDRARVMRHVRLVILTEHEAQGFDDMHSSPIDHEGRFRFIHAPLPERIVVRLAWDAQTLAEEILVPDTTSTDTVRFLDLDLASHLDDDD